MEKKYAINVKDLKKSVEFYSKFFSQKSKIESLISTEFSMLEPSIHLILTESLEVHHFDLELELGSSTKVKLWSNFLHAKGIEVSTTIRIKSDTSEVVQFSLTDPDNYKWKIFSRN